MYCYIRNCCLLAAIVMLCLANWVLPLLTYPGRVAYAIVLVGVSLTGIVMTCWSTGMAGLRDPTADIFDIDD